jgi:hypothetical protein
MQPAQTQPQTQCWRRLRRSKRLAAPSGDALGVDCLCLSLHRWLPAQGREWVPVRDVLPVAARLRRVSWRALRRKRRPQPDRGAMCGRSAQRSHGALAEHQPSGHEGGSASPQQLQQRGGCGRPRLGAVNIPARRHASHGAASLCEHSTALAIRARTYQRRADCPRAAQAQDLPRRLMCATGMEPQAACGPRGARGGQAGRRRGWRAQSPPRRPAERGERERERGRERERERQRRAGERAAVTATVQAGVGGAAARSRGHSGHSP